MRVAAGQFLRGGRQVFGDHHGVPTQEVHHDRVVQQLVLQLEEEESFYTGMFPVGDTSCRTLKVCVCVCVCVCVR